MAGVLASMAMGERGGLSPGQGEGQKKEWSVLGLDAGTSESVTCLLLLFPCESDQSDAATLVKAIV